MQKLIFRNNLSETLIPGQFLGMKRESLFSIKKRFFTWLWEKSSFMHIIQDYKCLIENLASKV